MTKEKIKYSEPHVQGMHIKEPSAAYAVNPKDYLPHNKSHPETDSKQGKYTIEDYYSLPDHVKAELIDGVIYAMSAPLTWHQLYVGKIYSELLAGIAETGKDCLPLIAPVDVQLDMDDRTLVEPDVIILCDLSRLGNKVIYGAPDLVMEIVSPSTRNRDMVLKLYKYMNAGVREYWIVDYFGRVVLQYDLEHNVGFRQYDFEVPVPVLISGGRCSIHFGEIERYYLERGVAPETSTGLL